MKLYEDAVVDIPASRERFFGRSGRMLLPGTRTVSALLQKIPSGKLITTYQLRLALANQFNVEAACPVTVLKVLKTLAKNPESSTPYWRVVTSNGGIFAASVLEHSTVAAQLNFEGIDVEEVGNKMLVKDLDQHLLHQI